jgi:hypothetical protein
LIPRELGSPGAHEGSQVGAGRAQSVEKLVNREKKGASDRMGSILGELRHEAKEAPVRLENGPAEHAEHARHPSAHSFTHARRLLGARDEVTHEGLLTEFESRHQPRRLRTGLHVSARERSFDVERLSAKRDPHHREHGSRILPPAGCRQLRFAHGTIPVQIEETLQRAPRGAVRDRVEAHGRIPQDRGSRSRVAPRDVRDAEDPDRRTRRFEISDSSGHRLRHLLRSERRDANQDGLERQVRREGAGRTRQHRRARAVEQDLEVSQRPRETVVRKDGEIERALGLCRLFGHGFETSQVRVQPELPPE